MNDFAPWIVVIGFGGNVGGEDAVRERFVRAREALNAYGTVLNHAPLYRSSPIGPAQPDFLNTAIMMRVDDGLPDELMAIVLEIEQLLGRDRRNEERWGPRKIDLDILIWGSRVVRTPHIELPHPRLRERRFALLPLMMLVPALTCIPGTQDKVRDLVNQLRDQPLEEIAASW